MAFTVNAAGTVVLYKDGVQESSGSISLGTGICNTTVPLYIGAGDKGTYDEVAIWSKVLTPAEIQLIYSRQSAAYAGVLTSRVMDAFQPGQNWTSLSWMPTLPFLKEIPDNGISENQSAYTSLFSSAQLSGIEALWHLDGVAGTTSIVDSSGNGNTAGITYSSPFPTITPAANTVVSGQPGLLGNAAQFNGTSSYISIPYSSSLNTAASASGMTLSAWVFPTSTASGQVFQFGHDTGLQSGWGINLTASATGASASVVTTSPSTQSSSVSVNLIPGRWNLLTLVRNGTSLILYANGGASTSTNLTIPATAIRYENASLIGTACGTASCASYFSGLIDEVAIWSRPLALGEVQQLYQRGAARIKFQVRSCSVATCSGVSWQGPDGTNGTYFSELENNSAYNTTTNLPSGSVEASLPVLTFASYASPTPAPNRYFQYRAILESDTSTAALMPQVKSISIAPTHYDPTSPTVVGDMGVKISTLTSFAQTLGGGGCSSVVYNLGVGNTASSASWYWWNSAVGPNCSSAGTGAWCPAGGTTATANSATVVNTNVGAFSAFMTLGSAYFKAFLISNGTTPCQLKNVQLNGQD